MMGAEPGLAVCAAHEDAQATATCARCGNNVCPLCLELDSALPDHCGACRARVGGGQMAWEREGLPWLRRWLLTTREVLLRPTDTFERCAPGPWTASLAYAAVTGALQAAVQFCFLLCGAGCLLAAGLWEETIGPEGREPLFVWIMVGVLVAYPLMVVGFHLLLVVVRGALFHAGVMVSGGGEGFAVSFWGAGYVHAIQLATLVAAILGNLPLIGPLITLFVYLAIEVWTALQLTTIARVRHHLTPQRATLAGWTPFLVFSAIGVGCCALMVLWFVSTPMWPDQ